MPAPSRTPDAGPPAVTVWWAHRSLAGALDEGLLSGVERARVARLRGAADRERSAVARGVLRLALAVTAAGPPAAGASASSASPASIEIDWTRGPVLPASPGVWASVSHSDDAVAVAVSTAGPVGVDVESLRRTADLVPAVQESVFTKAERAELHALRVGGQSSLALRLWTLKEAVLKATGDGLIRAPSTLELAGLGPDVAPRITRFDGRDDLTGDRTRLFGLTPVVQPFAGVADARGAAEVPGRARPSAGGYVASVAIITGGPVEVVERDAAELVGA